MARRTIRRRLTPPIAALLVVVQALAGGTVALAHAEEPTPSRVRLESGHTAQCPPLHDEIRCTLCQFSSLRVTLRPPAPDRAVRRTARFEFQPAASLVVTARPAPHVRPRAPPAVLR